jgi:hypothetical protein
MKSSLSTKTEALGPDPDDPGSPVDDSDDYGSIGPEEFARRIQTDNDARYGTLIRNASWVSVGEPGW